MCYSKRSTCVVKCVTTFPANFYRLFLKIRNLRKIYSPANIWCP